MCQIILYCYSGNVHINLKNINKTSTKINIKSPNLFSFSFILNYYIFCFITDFFLFLFLIWKIRGATIKLYFSFQFISTCLQKNTTLEAVKLKISRQKHFESFCCFYGQLILTLNFLAIHLQICRSLQKTHMIQIMYLKIH